MQRLLPLLIALAAPFALATNVYQYKDANGNTVFSDQPPPGQSAVPKTIKPNVMQTSGGSYTMREALHKAPVTLWSNNCGESCDNARSLLAKRGIPYGLRNPEASEADFKALKALAGASIVPVLQVGGATLKGYQEADWQAALDQAGYPKSADPTLKPTAPVAQPMSLGGKPATPPATPAPASSSPPPGK